MCHISGGISKTWQEGEKICFNSLPDGSQGSSEETNAHCDSELVESGEYKRSIEVVFQIDI